MYYKENQIQTYDYTYDLMYNKNKTVQNENNRQDFSEIPISLDDQIKQKIEWIRGMLQEILNNDPRFETMINNILAKFEQYLTIAKTKQYKLELLDVVVMKVMEQIKYTVAKSHTDTDIEKVTDTITPQQSRTFEGFSQQLPRFIDSLLVAIQQLRGQVPKSEQDLQGVRFKYFRKKTGYDQLKKLKYTEEELKDINNPQIQDALNEWAEYKTKYIINPSIWDTLENEIRLS